MDISKIFKNAVLNLYKSKVYTVDYAIIKASELARTNNINAIDYEGLLTHLAKEQQKEMEEMNTENENPNKIPNESLDDELKLEKML